MEPQILLFSNHSVSVRLFPLSVCWPPNIGWHMLVYYYCASSKKGEIAWGPSVCHWILLTAVWIVPFLILKLLRYFLRGLSWLWRGREEWGKPCSIHRPPVSWPKSRVTFSLWSASSNLLTPWRETKNKEDIEPQMLCHP